jgi:uncharacterized protein with GYD domain
MVEAAGGKVVALYMTTGDSDVLLISEFADGDTAVALGMAAAASGSVSNLSTCRAWTGEEFKSVAQNASKLAGAYTPPGARRVGRDSRVARAERR